MRPPTFQELRENFREFFADYIPSFAGHYIFAGGGTIIGFALLLFPNAYQGVRVSGVWLVVLLFIIAGYLAWRDERRRANEEHQKVLSLKERMMPQISVSCSCDDEQCVLPPSQTTYGLFRVIVSLGGADLITNVKARIEALRKDGEKLRLHEPVRLRFHSADATGELKTMSPETDEPLDMLRLESSGVLSLALAWNYANFDSNFCKDPGRTYEMDVSISSSILPFKFTYVCPWTGDFSTTKPYIK